MNQAGRVSKIVPGTVSLYRRPLSLYRLTVPGTIFGIELVPNLATASGGATVPMIFFVSYTDISYLLIFAGDFKSVVWFCLRPMV